MWISSAVQKKIDDLYEQIRGLGYQNGQLAGENARLTATVAEQRTQMNWFMHRLNQVEKERAQLVMAASGVKIAAPSFVTADEDPIKALQEMPDFAMVGADAPEDYGMMPQRVNN